MAIVTAGQFGMQKLQICSLRQNMARPIAMVTLFRNCALYQQ